MMMTACILFSFKPSDYNLLLKTGVYQLEEGQLEKGLAGPAVDGYRYRIMQFYTLPTQSQKSELKNKGILFFDYMPKNAYLVAIPTQLEANDLQDYSIRSIASLDPGMKLTSAVALGEYPEWAIESAGKYTLIAAFYSNISKEKISKELNKLDVAYSFRPDAGFVRLTGTLSQIEAFCQSCSRAACPITQATCESCPT